MCKEYKDINSGRSDSSNKVNNPDTTTATERVAIITGLLVVIVLIAIVWLTA